MDDVTKYELKLENIGQIAKATISFGDLTVLVGPQATGKSIALQLLKLIVDTGHVFGELKRYGLDWSKKLDEFLDIYLGEGMRRLWRESESVISWQNKKIDLVNLVGRQRRVKEETMFYIPAQRVLTLRDGWPRPFTDYSPGDPYAVREFSEKLRLLLEQEFTATEGLFPQERRVKKELRELLSQAFFPGYDLHIDRYRSQRRLVLQAGESKENLPFMVWSAGQREFVPLLLGFYWLMPPTKVPRRQKIEWVVIEELEMGLHPQAISVTMLMVLELLWRGYRVCLSTHSPHVLDVVWALQKIKTHQADARLLLDIFKARPTPSMQDLAKTALKQAMQVYYFDRDGTAHDISQLDPGSSNALESGWGGITEFSGRIADVVSQAVAQGAAR
ncbi:ATP-binding protein [candidate division KSB1 bacterium]|nr:ATP-binding protein [candidate division KSB1 bacterium]